MSLVLGINAFHPDSAACLVRDGRVVAAAEEERFRRIKHWAGFPAQAIAWCLADAGVGLGDLDLVAVNADPGAARWRKLAHVLGGRASPGLVAERLAARRRRASVEACLAEMPGGDRLAASIARIEHHRAHLASAFLGAGLDRAALLSLDGFGDFSSAAWGQGAGATIEEHGRIHFPHSLGAFYEAVTRYLGFERYGDEYKVMGLAAYGEPRHRDAMRELVRVGEDGRFALDLAYFRHASEPIAPRWDGGEPTCEPLFTARWEALLGPPRRPDEPLEERHRDIAASAQWMFEEALAKLVDAQLAPLGEAHLALAGGCAMNSLAIGRLHASGRFRSIAVHPAAGDAGGAVGAALAAWQAASPGATPGPLAAAYLGPRATREEIVRCLEDAGDALAAAGCAVAELDDEDALVAAVAAALEAGAVVGWFQGRMEWGPRALGNRSILCDPRRSDARELINAKIKRREPFRPFAPALPRERVGEWFTDVADVPYMTHVLEIRPERRAQIPAVTHVDGTGRLQTVTESTNPRFHRLIEAFGARTGVPILLNTSFNENEPIVCRPVEALACFLRTGMDLLVLGDHLVARDDARGALAQTCPRERAAEDAGAGRGET